MANFKIEKVKLDVNQVTGSNYYYFVYDAANLQLKKGIEHSTNPDEIVHSKWDIYAADTEQACVDEISRLGLK